MSSRRSQWCLVALRDLFNLSPCLQCSPCLIMICLSNQAINRSGLLPCTSCSYWDTIACMLLTHAIVRYTYQEIQAHLSCTALILHCFNYFSISDSAFSCMNVNAMLRYFFISLYYICILYSHNNIQFMSQPNWMKKQMGREKANDENGLFH